LNEKYNVDINPDLITLPHRIEMVWEYHVTLQIKTLKKDFVVDVKAE
jgi:hypothetical protein